MSDSYNFEKLPGNSSLPKDRKPLKVTKTSVVENKITRGDISRTIESLNSEKKRIESELVKFNSMLSEIDKVLDA